VKKLGRFLIFGIGIAVVITGILLIGVNLYVQSQGTQIKIQRELSRRLGTTLKLRRISVTPWAGLKLSGITIPQSDPGSSGNFLEAKTFRLRVQFSSLFGGQTRVLTEVGLTSSEYARIGFAQMVTAALLTLGLIGFAWFTGGANNVAFRVSAAALVVLDLVMLGSAFQRLTLYEKAYGWTQLRLVVHVFIIWLAFVLIGVLIALVINRFRWIVFATLALGFGALVTLNVINPDSFVASHNIERYAATGRLDTTYFSYLSEDAVPAITAALPTLPAKQQRATVEALRGGLACSVLGNDHPWFSFNLARERARTDAAGICANPPADLAAGPAGSSES
jgi:hypothetical protein